MTPNSFADVQKLFFFPVFPWCVSFLRIIVCVHVFNSIFACLFVFHINRQPQAPIFRANLSCQELPCDFCPAKLKQRPGCGFLDDDLWWFWSKRQTAKRNIFGNSDFPVYTAKFWLVDLDEHVEIVMSFCLTWVVWHTSPASPHLLTHASCPNVTMTHASQAGSKLWT